MADVAAQAGVSKGTPYLYFDSKQALFLALHEQWECGAGQRADAAVAALPDQERRSPPVHRHDVRAHDPVAPGTRLVLLAGRRSRGRTPWHVQSVTIPGNSFRTGVKKIRCAYCQTNAAWTRRPWPGTGGMLTAAATTGGPAAAVRPGVTAISAVPWPQGQWRCSA
jgi:Bacterial regulatory proteins, tetR family